MSEIKIVQRSTGLTLGKITESETEISEEWKALKKEEETQEDQIDQPDRNDD
jgi:hypothetical protein